MIWRGETLPLSILKPRLATANTIRPVANGPSSASKIQAIEASMDVTANNHRLALLSLYWCEDPQQSIRE